MKQVKSGRSPRLESTSVFESWADDSKGLILYACEDVQNAGDAAVVALQGAGYRVHQMDISRLLLNRVLTDSLCRLVMFDIAQPFGPGFRLCSQLRAVWRGPIVVILRGAARADIMRAFEAGADMYLIASFDPAELVGRVTALLRRSGHDISAQASG